MAFYLFQISATILVLLLLLVILLLKICGKKAAMYLISLGLAGTIIATFILPLISRGYNPILITLVASIPITVLIIYCAEGFTLLSNISIVVTVFTFTITALLTYFSVYFAHFTGIVSDTAEVVGGQNGINLQNLLSAGIMLSALGAIIEMAITQVATVVRFVSLNKNMDVKQVYKQSNDVGVAHLGAIISTLFLLYAGVSLPLLIIFAGPGTSVGILLGYEPFSSEIVRMLTGIIGLIIAMPVSTGFTIWWMKRKI
jgi:uncharacterized membrane protein